MIKNIKAKNQALKKIAPLLLALTIVFTYSRLFIMPAFKNWRNLAAKVTQLKQNVKAAEASIAGIETLKSQLNNLKQRVGSYEDRLPQQREIPTLLQNLSSMALESGVKITTVEPAKEAASPSSKDYMEIPISLTAKSGYHQLGIFISKLENSRRFMKVSNIKISRNADDSYHHNADLKISTFLLSENDTLISEKK